MSKANEEKAPEIVPLNDDWVDFDLENLSVEDLEQRFEMSLITLPLSLSELEVCKDRDCSSCTLGCCVN